MSHTTVTATTGVRQHCTKFRPVCLCLCTRDLPPGVQRMNPALRTSTAVPGHPGERTSDRYSVVLSLFAECGACNRPRVRTSPLLCGHDCVVRKQCMQMSTRAHAIRRPVDPKLITRRSSSRIVSSARQSEVQVTDAALGTQRRNLPPARRLEFQTFLASFIHAHPLLRLSPVIRCCFP